MSNTTTTGNLIPTSVDTPLDARSRVASEADIMSIENPSVGLVVYAIKEKRHYRVTALKERTVDGRAVANGAVASYERFDAETIAECERLRNETQAIHDSIVAVNTFMVGNAYNYGVTVSGNAVSVCWTDPSDLVTSEMATIAFWGKTRLVMKTGGFPENERDGEVLVDSSVRDQYRETPFVKDLGSASNYYFALFTCTTGGIWNTSPTAPRFTTDLLTVQTIAMMTRSNTLLQYPGMEIGAVLDIQVNSLYPKLRYKLAHVNYGGGWPKVSDFHYDHTKTYNSIWIPNYLPCIGEDMIAQQIQFDAPELAYAMTADEIFVVGKKYYKVVDGAYVEMVAGSDYQDGENVAAWAESKGYPAYSKNHANRASYGCNSHKDSNMRQWLNATGRNWFKKQNEYDVMSTGKGYDVGWMTGFTPDFLGIVQSVYNRTARNTISVLEGGGGGGYDVTLDRFWLPSIKEVFNTNSNNIAEGEQFEYFKSVAVAPEDRIQRDEGGTARYVWLRSAHTGHTHYVYCVNTSGSSNHAYAYFAYAFLPAVCIA